MPKSLNCTPDVLLNNELFTTIIWPSLFESIEPINRWIKTDQLISVFNSPECRPTVRYFENWEILSGPGCSFPLLWSFLRQKLVRVSVTEISRYRKVNDLTGSQSSSFEWTVFSFASIVVSCLSNPFIFGFPRDHWINSCGHSLKNPMNNLKPFFDFSGHFHRLIPLLTEKNFPPWSSLESCQVFEYKLESSEKRYDEREYK